MRDAIFAALPLQLHATSSSFCAILYRLYQSQDHASPAQCRHHRYYHFLPSIYASFCIPSQCHASQVTGNVPKSRYHHRVASTPIVRCSYPPLKMKIIFSTKPMSLAIFFLKDNIYLAAIDAGARNIEQLISQRAAVIAVRPPYPGPRARFSYATPHGMVSTYRRAHHILIRDMRCRSRRHATRPPPIVAAYAIRKPIADVPTKNVVADCIKLIEK